MHHRVSGFFQCKLGKDPVGRELAPPLTGCTAKPSSAKKAAASCYPTLYSLGLRSLR